MYIQIKKINAKHNLYDYSIIIELINFVFHMRGDTLKINNKSRVGTLIFTLWGNILKCQKTKFID